MTKLKAVVLVGGLALSGMAGFSLAQMNGDPPVQAPVPEGKRPMTKEERVRALIDHVLAAHGGADKLTAFTLTVEHSYKQTQRYFVRPPKNLRWETTHPDRPAKRIVILFPDGRRWWRQKPNEAAEEFLLTGAELTVAAQLDRVKFFGPRQVLRLTDAEHTVEPVDEVEVAGRAAVGVRVRGPCFKQTLYFDKVTHLLVKAVGNDHRHAVTYSDYQTFDGIPVATREDDGERMLRVTGFRVVDRFDAALFERP